MSDRTTPTITVITTEQQEAVLAGLVTLLQETVDTGASIGFLPPLSEPEAREYWQKVFQDVATGTRIVLAAYVEGSLAGTVQLELATKANARHRAEIQKLFVSPRQRRKRIAYHLMEAIERVAHNEKRSLLVLDTREGDSAEQLYRKIGYTEAGRIPQYAEGANGVLEGTIYFYKLLTPHQQK